MSEFGGLWKHEHNQHALVPPKTECGCPSGGGIKNGHIRYPSYGGTQTFFVVKNTGGTFYTFSRDYTLFVISLLFYIKGDINRW